MEASSKATVGEGSYENPWTYKNTTFTSADIDDKFGFVYCITNNTNGRQYIGRNISGSLELQGVKNEK